MRLLFPCPFFYFIFFPRSHVSLHHPAHVFLCTHTRILFVFLMLAPPPPSPLKSSFGVHREALDKSSSSGGRYLQKKDESRSEKKKKTSTFLYFICWLYCFYFPSAAVRLAAALPLGPKLDQSFPLFFLVFYGHADKKKREERPANSNNKSDKRKSWGGYII